MMGRVLSYVARTPKSSIHSDGVPSVWVGTVMVYSPGSTLPEYVTVALGWPS